MPRLRQSVALLCVAVVVLTALIPVAVVFEFTPLVLLGDLSASDDASPTPPRPAEPATQGSLQALVSSRHIARAALPARS